MKHLAFKQEKKATPYLTLTLTSRAYYLGTKMKCSLIFILSLFSSLLVAQQLPEHGIEVIGKASIKVQADQFVFTVVINERGSTASKMKALVDQKSRLVVDKYLSLGIDKKTIESSRLLLIPRYEKLPRGPEFEMHQRVNNRANHSTARSGAKKSKIVVNNRELMSNVKYHPTKIYFEVSRTITITFTDFEKYDQLLDHVVKIGVSRISPLQTAVINNELYYQQALISALKNATTKAENIAQQIGVQLGSITHLKESPYHAPRAYRMASESSSNFNSQVAKNNISAQVNVTFAINKDN